MTFIPRDYQVEDVAAIVEAFKTHRAVLAVASTGLGKTEEMVSLVQAMNPRRTLFLAHRGKLIHQARKKFMARGFDVDIEKAELSAPDNPYVWAPVVVATVQTLNSGKPDMKRMKRFNPMDFDLVEYDETHYAVAAGNRSIVDYFLNGNPNLKLAGFTATPERSDRAAMGQIFTAWAFNRDIVWGINNGWLIKPLQLMVHIENLDFTHMRTTCGDLNSADLGKVMEEEDMCHRVATPALEAMFRLKLNYLKELHPSEWSNHLFGTPRKTIVFTVNVKQAEMLMNVFNRVRPGLATHVHGKMPETVQEQQFERFAGPDCHILCNCNVVTEGYDLDTVEIIVMAAPTKSGMRYKQRIGRCTRPIAGTVDGPRTMPARKLAIMLSRKPSALVIDLVGVSGHHKLVSMANILGGSLTPKAIERANERIKAMGVSCDAGKIAVQEEEAIHKEIEERRLKAEAKKAALVAKVQYSTTHVDAFDVLDIQPERKVAVDRLEPLSEKGKNWLMSQGYNVAVMPIADQRAILKEKMRRFRLKLATEGQCKAIKRMYPTLDTSNLPKAKADRIMNALANNNWQYIPLSQIQ